MKKTKKIPSYLKKPRKYPKQSEKNPRTQDRIEKPKILGENPRGGNADCGDDDFMTSVFNAGAMPLQRNVSKQIANVYKNSMRI